MNTKNNIQNHLIGQGFTFSNNRASTNDGVDWKIGSLNMLFDTGLYYKVNQVKLGKQSIYEFYI